MLVRISSGLMLAMLLGVASVGQAKTFAKIDSLAKRLLHRTVSAKNAILSSKQAIVGAVGIAALSCGTIACEKIQQPMMDGFTRSGDPSSITSIGRYDVLKHLGGSYHAETVTSADPDGMITSDVAVPITLHTRMESFGDFRLSIGAGPYRNDLYGFVAGDGDSFAIHDALVGGNRIGSGTHAFARTELSINLPDSEGGHVVVIKLFDSQVESNIDNVYRVIDITVQDRSSGGLTTYNTELTWDSSLSSSLVSSPSSASMPDYQQIANEQGIRSFVELLDTRWGRSNFVERLAGIGSFSPSLVDLVHGAFSTTVYTAVGVSGRKRIKKSGGFTQYWDEGSFSGVSVRLTVRDDNTANISLDRGSSSHVTDIPIGGTVTLGSGFQTHNWTLQLGDLMTAGSSLYRDMSLSAISASEFRAFNFIGIHVDQSSQYYIDNARLGWDIDASFTASGW